MKHKHHIVPKHAGGTDDPSNLLEVSIEEHAELHLARYLQFGEAGDWYAFMGLSGQMTKEEIIAETCRSRLGVPHTEETKRKMRKPHGPKHTESSKLKIAEAQRGRKKSPEHRAKISASLKGNKNSLGYVPTEEHRQNLSQAMKGNTNASK